MAKTRSAGAHAPVLTELRGDTCFITLNRPERLNAINDSLVQGLSEALDDAADPKVRVVVLRGAGRAFCSGHDLKVPLEQGQPDVSRRRLARLQDVTRKIDALDQPVIAAVHGWAVGAGAEIALNCDLIVADCAARFMFPEVSVGLTMTNGLSHVLAAAAGPQRAKRIMFLKEIVTATDLHGWGLISHLAEATDLEVQTMALAKDLGSLPPTALASAKHLVNGGRGSDLPSALERELLTAMAVDPEEYGGAAR
jgi:enoyl-CoA hydratase/carnithine racemase